MATTGRAAPTTWRGVAKAYIIWTNTRLGAVIASRAHSTTRSDQDRLARPSVNSIQGPKCRFTTDNDRVAKRGQRKEPLLTGRDILRKVRDVICNKLILAVTKSSRAQTGSHRERYD